MIPLLLIGVIVAIVIAGWALRGRVAEATPPEPVGRRLQRAPLVALRQLRPDTDVRVVGRISVDAQAPLVAPMSGRPCIAWHIVLERRMNASDTDRQEYWEPELTEESGNAVELEDEGGRATVRLAGARWQLGREHIERLVDDGDLTGPIRAFLRRNRISWGGYVKPSYRFREQVLERGAQICIFGQATPQRALVAGGGGYRDAPATLVFAVGRARPLALCDPRR